MVKTKLVAGCALLPLILTACSGAAPDAEQEDTSAPAVASTRAEAARHARDDGFFGDVIEGKALFDNPLPHSNGRACSTCHVDDQHFVLLPASVVARYEANPDDPLFNALDADDPTATPLTYDHLQKGLIRITLTLADNLDVVDDEGNVITNAARTIDVWRGVPTVENTALTAPYMYDGREPNLQIQALHAFQAHSAIQQDPTEDQLDDIADFEQTVYSGLGPALVEAALAADLPPPDLDHEPFPPGSAEAAGEVIFNQACAACHGGPQGDKVTNQAAHDQLFPALNPDGTMSFVQLPAGQNFPAQLLTTHHDDDFFNIATATATAFAQIGLFPDHLGVPLPQYRIRFYTDATRSTVQFDLPPLPPLVGPSRVPVAFSVDPGRCIITGDPADWEAFDIPQLHGIKNTAPYFHDNSAPDLLTVVTFYSQFILPVVPALGFPGDLPPEAPGQPNESLSPLQKQQLIAYLNTL